MNFAALPNRTVWTAGFQCVLHAAVDHCEVLPRPPGWIPNRGTGETMVIQAGGSPAYDGIDRYRVERAGDGLQFVGVAADGSLYE